MNRIKRQLLLALLVMTAACGSIGSGRHAALHALDGGLEAATIIEKGGSIGAGSAITLIGDAVAIGGYLSRPKDADEAGFANVLHFKAPVPKDCYRDYRIDEDGLHLFRHPLGEGEPCPFVLRGEIPLDLLAPPSPPLLDLSIDGRSAGQVELIPDGP